MARKKSVLLSKIKESVNSVLPITGIVLLLGFTIAPIDISALMSFVIGALLLMLGMGFFTLGAEMSMTPLGERVGAVMTKTRKPWLILVGCFILGVIITVSEPDLTVLATQVPSIPNEVIILSVAIGVGIFLMVAFLRILLQIPLRWLLIGCYVVAFALAFIAPRNFLAVAFDSGGVTTGPMTVPFIMAFGVGIASIRSDKQAENDSFGMVALCSVGPILAVLLLSLFFRPVGGDYIAAVIPMVNDSIELGQLFMAELPHYLAEVFTALSPIFVFFVLFQIFAMRLRRRALVRYIVGLAYTFFGLTLFLTGVNVGFMSVGSELGRIIASLPERWLLVPIGMVIGYFIVAAEPAVHVLNKQVEAITAGAIPPKAMSMSLSIGVSVSVGLAMLRVLTGLPILWLLIPGYGLAIVLSFFVPPIFTSIAFDSGGVASGPMTATFLLPLAVGASSALGGDVVSEAFGVVAMVAMTPLITIQLMGMIYQHKLVHKSAQEPILPPEEEIIDL
ncbi:MAG: DUF1538 domain-containing protein [Eubacteriales bacterium]|nr:DUF1538 domain-containing protein [Eubacteriales bacterium]